MNRSKLPTAVLKRLLPCLIAPFLGVAALPNRAVAFTPDDPVVAGMIRQGVSFLESAKTKDEGEIALLAYTHYKVEHDESNPIVQAGLKAAEKLLADNTRTQGFKGHYEIAIVAMLYCELGPGRYRSQLSQILRYFNEHQRANGSFTYPKEKLGDTSQTQYAILALWTMDRYGFKIDYGRMKKAMDWLFAVQDIRGPWPYHGEFPPGNRRIVQEKEISESMCVAGAASLLIAGDALRLWGASSASDETGIVGLPKAIKLYEGADKEQERKKAKVKPEAIFSSISQMEQWRSKNPDKFTNNLYWYFYMIYTIERYESFKEIAMGTASNPSPGWYNKIVGDLKQRQDPKTGGWTDRALTQPHVSTCFALLFLIRSTKKSLGEGASASTVGGKGFSKDISKATLKNGSAFTRAPAQSVTNMLDLLEDDGADELGDKSLSDNATLTSDPTERAAQLDRLERLVRGSSSWQARRVSAKLLGTSDDFRVVPALIFALSDPDHAVRAYARDGLRFISRNFEGYGMPDEPTNSDIRNAQRSWRTWYKRVRPDHVFIEE